MRLNEAKRHVLKIKKELADLDFLLWRIEVGDYSGQESLVSIESSLLDTAECIKIQCEFFVGKVKD